MFLFNKCSKSVRSLQRAFSTHNVVVFRGDGVGPELVNAAVGAVNATGVSINWVECGNIGSETREETGEYITEEQLDVFEKHKTLFKGPLTISFGAESFVNIRGREFTSPNQVFRKLYQLYANVRPAKLVAASSRVSDGWVEGTFKDTQQCFVRIHDGQIESEENKCYIKYYLTDGAKVYRPFIGNVKLNSPTQEQPSSLGMRDFSGTDLVVVRENTEDIYTGEETVIDQDTIEGIKRITRNASNRIARFAFDYARKNDRNRVTAVHKANVCKKADGLFLEECRTVSRLDENLPFVYDEHLADSLLTKLVLHPQEWDVLVCPNLYGDFISDLAGGIIGSLGLMPSGQFGESHAVFEPTHGSAPDIAGQGIANPVSQLRCAVMMLAHLGEQVASQQLDDAIDQILIESKYVTPDLGGSSSTLEMTEAIIQTMASRSPLAGMHT